MHPTVQLWHHLLKKNILNQLRGCSLKLIEIIQYQPTIIRILADSITIGLVEINDPKKSVNRETIDKFIRDADVGVGITDIVSSTGTAHTIHTGIDHGFNRVQN